MQRNRRSIMTRVLATGRHEGPKIASQGGIDREARCARETKAVDLFIALCVVVGVCWFKTIGCAWRKWAVVAARLGSARSHNRSCR
jgi:hypothetical protein